MTIVHTVAEVEWRVDIPDDVSVPDDLITVPEMENRISEQLSLTRSYVIDSNIDVTQEIEEQE